MYSLDSATVSVRLDEYTALRQLYDAMLDLDKSPIGYSPLVAEAMKRLKELHQQ